MHASSKSHGEQDQAPFGFLLDWRCHVRCSHRHHRSMNVSFFDATPATAISHIIEIAMAVAVIVLVYRHQMEFDFISTVDADTRCHSNRVIVGKLPASMAEQVSIATLSSGHLLLVIFYWLSLCDIAHREPAKPSDIVFGIGWPTYALPWQSHRSLCCL